MLDYCESPHGGCFRNSWWKIHFPQGLKSSTLQPAGPVRHYKIHLKVALMVCLVKAVFFFTKKHLRFFRWNFFSLRSAFQTELLSSCARQFARWHPWVGEGCGVNCEQWKAGTRPLVIQRAFYTGPQCWSPPVPGTKSSLKPTLCGLVHPSDRNTLPPFWFLK